MCSSESISQSPAVANTFGAQPFQFVCEVVVSSFSFGRSFVLFQPFAHTCKTHRQCDDNNAMEFKYP